jgi:hypothetical protein
LAQALAQPRHRRKGRSTYSEPAALIAHVQELGLNIPDSAIEQMKANLELDEAQMKVAAEEEKKRRRESGI